MKSLKFALRLCAASLAITAATPASAVVVVATYTGIVDSVIYYDGIFGTDIAGKAFTATYSFDSDVNSIHFQADALSSQRYGQYANIPVTGSITINGITINAGQTFGSSYRYDGFGGPGNVDVIDHVAENVSVDDETQNSLYFRAGVNFERNVFDGLDHTALVNQTRMPGDHGYGLFLDSSTSLTSYDTTYRNFLILRTDALNISPAGAIPEPTTWAMMIGGFAMAGAALRRRKRLSPVGSFAQA